MTETSALRFARPSAVLFETSLKAETVSPVSDILKRTVLQNQSESDDDVDGHVTCL